MAEQDGSKTYCPKSASEDTWTEMKEWPEEPCVVAAPSAQAFMDMFMPILCDQLDEALDGEPYQAKFSDLASQADDARSSGGLRDD